MKFRDKRSGVVYEPSSEQVACWMAKDQNLEAVMEPEIEEPKKAAPKKPKKKTE